MEEIDEIPIDSCDPFYADAIANEKAIDLSEEQRRNFRKVETGFKLPPFSALHPILICFFFIVVESILYFPMYHCAMITASELLSIAFV